MQLEIDPEFDALMPPLRAEELERLHAALDAAGGATEPLIAWADGARLLLVDGHNRYRHCSAKGLAFKIDVKPFTDRAAVKSWIYNHQLARRNLTPDQWLAVTLAAGLPKPPTATALQVARLAEIRAEKHDLFEKVRRGPLTVAAAWGAYQRSKGIRKPPTQPRPEREPGDLSAAREHAQRTFEKTHTRVLEKKLIEAEKREAFYTELHSVPTIKCGAEPKSGKREGTPWTIASDWHVGEVVTEAETQGRNTYDLKEARRRAGNFWDNVLWLRKDIQRTVTARDHVLNLNGDMISGSIHDELAETNEVGLVDQVSEAAAMIEAGIRALAPTCRRLIIPCTHGNHGRWTKKSLIKIGWEVSLETMLYRFLVRACKDLENVEFHVPKAESLRLEIHGYRFGVQHGTHIKSQGGIGGILVPLTRWAIRRATADYYVFGHFHQACAFGKVIVNGSLIGASAYSEENAFEYREPEQVNFVVDAKRGLRRFDQVSVT